MSLREWFMSSACLVINHIMIQCAIYNFLVIEIENIKANKIFCSVSFIFYLCVGCQKLYLSRGRHMPL